MEDFVGSIKRMDQKPSPPHPSTPSSNPIMLPNISLRLIPGCFCSCFGTLDFVLDPLGLPGLLGSTWEGVSGLVGGISLFIA